VSADPVAQSWDRIEAWLGEEQWTPAVFELTSGFRLMPLAEIVGQWQMLTEILGADSADPDWRRRLEQAGLAPFDAQRYVEDEAVAAAGLGAYWEITAAVGRREQFLSDLGAVSIPADAVERLELAEQERRDAVPDVPRVPRKSRVYPH
jgi:hypothetical protein